ncbi:S8 family serine peptidase [Streptomyces sp. NRRL F-2890]|uniref:S8 family serine peptidase n=1 Tax=Streptomyces sp. NRRL F-2890 TaxID=1463845 RepID=UPI00131A5B6A|nr:S8 family serine peptidase [Streptomyces sp. NRRL F-2890]
MTHRDLAGLLAGARPDALIQRGETLERVAETVEWLGDQIWSRANELEWQGQAADEFREWIRQFHHASVDLKTYASFMATAITNAGVALQQAKSEMPPAPPMEMPATALDVAMDTGGGNRPMTMTEAESNRQEAIAVIARLGSVYKTSAGTIEHVNEREPKFKGLNAYAVPPSEGDGDTSPSAPLRSVAPDHANAVPQGPVFSHRTPGHSSTPGLTPPVPEGREGSVGTSLDSVGVAPNGGAPPVAPSGSPPPVMTERPVSGGVPQQPVVGPVPGWPSPAQPGQGPGRGGQVPPVRGPGLRPGEAPVVRPLGPPSGPGSQPVASRIPPGGVIQPGMNAANSRLTPTRNDQPNTTPRPTYGKATVDGRPATGRGERGRKQPTPPNTPGTSTPSASKKSGNTPPASEGGIRGLAPGASILPVRIGGEVSFFNDSDRLGEGIQYAIDSGAQIINISMGGPLSMDSLDDLIAASARHDILIFAGSGNNGDINNAVTAPAAYDGVIGVGAVDQSGERAAYSTYGEQVALAAPGEGVPGHCAGLSDPPCLRNDGGTSSATALASASAALIWSQHPDWTKNQVLRVMLNTAERPDDQRRDDYTGYGVVRPDRVVIDGEGDPGDPDSPPIFRDWEAGLVPPVTPGPTPETTPDDSAEPAPGPEAEAAATSENGGSLPWILGGTTAVLLVAVTGWVLYRRRV